MTIKLLTPLHVERIFNDCMKETGGDFEVATEKCLGLQYNYYEEKIILEQLALKADPIAKIPQSKIDSVFTERVRGKDYTREPSVEEYPDPETQIELGKDWKQFWLETYPSIQSNINSRQAEILSEMHEPPAPQKPKIEVLEERLAALEALLETP